MKASQFRDQLDAAMDRDTSDIPVKVIDEDGFVHDVREVVFDPESDSICIRTAWKGDE